MATAYPLYPPRPGQHPDLPNKQEAIDPSEALFSMYLARSDEDDEKLVKRWKAESDAILIFTGLFSAALAALISVSIQDLRSDPQTTSAFYLANIYHLLANATSSQPIVLPIPADPPKFSPSKSAVWVNSFWFLSLVMTLTGALLAVFVQQWAHSYLQATQQRHIPRNRARIRAYYYQGIEKWHLPRITRAVPTLIHFSLILFFAGLPVFLFNVNRTVFNVVVTWLGLCVGGYACITVMPIFSQDSPYYSPLSSSAWWCVTRALSLVLWLLESLARRDSYVFRRYNTYYTNSPLGWSSSRGIRKISEHTALQLKPEIDYNALSWMFRTLNDDDEFEQFFDALPGLCESIALEDHQEGFIEPNQDRLSTAMVGLMNRTLSSNLVSENVKQRRILICTRALDAASFLGPWWILPRVLDDWRRFLECIEFGLFVQNWKRITLPVTKFYAQCAVSIIISSVRERKESWFQLAGSHLKMSKSLLQNYYAHGDSILLANIIFIIRHAVESYYSASSESNQTLILDGFSKTLELVCKFDIKNTLPGLQHEFCSLWNQLIDANHTHPHTTRISMVTLKGIRRLYLALHEGTPAFPTAFTSLTDDEDPILDDATSYPKCTADQHPPSPPVPNLPLVGPLRNVAGNARLVSASTTATASSPVQVLTLPSTLPAMPHPPPSTSTLPSHVRAPFDAPLADPQSRFATAPPPRDLTVHFPQMVRTYSTGVPVAIAEPDTQQDPGMSCSSSRFIPDAARERSVEVSPSPSPTSRFALSASPHPRDEMSTHSDSLEEHIHSLQT